MPMPSAGPGPFDHLREQWAVRLTTFRRDGRPVGTAVNLAVDGERAVVRTYEETWKFKRLQHDPRVEVAPSDLRGNATGPAIRARARLLDGDEDARAAALIDRKHPVFQRRLVRTVHRVAGYHTRHFELTAED